MNLQYTYLSPVFTKIFGYRISEYLGRCLYEMLAFDSKKLIWQSFTDVVNEEKNGAGDPEKTILLELESIHKHGFVIWTEVIVSFTRSVSGEVNGVIGATRDITERIRAKEALDRSNMAVRKSNEDLRMTREQLVQAEKMAALGGLVAGVSHEISTPLGIGVTASSFLQQKTEEFMAAFTAGLYNDNDVENYMKKASESSSMIFNNLRRAAELINSFKQVAVDQSNEFQREFDVQEYINNIIISLRPELKKSGHEVEVYCPEKIKYQSFPGAFSQVVTNLVMNSITHGYDAGESGKIRFNIVPNNGYICFRYSDNGKGMSKEVLDKIFDPFFTTQRATGGTGLGMHIVYNIVNRKLGGTIECESTEGEGTSFLIKLPH
jgi:PAS domain S-box-containing protein